MKVETKFNVGDKVWTLHLQSMRIIEREITGVRMQSFGQGIMAAYSFVKDGSAYSGEDGVSPYFWLPENACHLNKSDLIKTLDK